MLCSVIEHSMTPFRFQTAQKTSASLRSSVREQTVNMNKQTMNMNKQTMNMNKQTMNMNKQTMNMNKQTMNDKIK